MTRLYLFFFSFLLVFSNAIYAYKESIQDKYKDKALQFLKAGQLDSSRHYYQQLIEGQEFNLNTKALAYNNLGVIDIREGFNERGLSYFERAINLYQESKNDSLLATAYYNTGRFYKRLSQYDKATELLLKALEIFEKDSLKEKIEMSCNILGNLSRKTNDLDLSVEFFEKAINSAASRNDSFALASYLNNKGKTFLKMEFFNEAFQVFQEAINIKKSLYQKDSISESEKTRLYQSIAYTYYNLGEAEFSRGRYTEAIQELNNSIQIHREADNQREIAFCYNLLGNIYSKLEEWNKAVTFLDRAQAIAIQLSMNDLLKDNYKFQYVLNESRKNQDKALKYYKLYMEQYEKLLNQEKQKAIKDLQLKYKVNQIKQENQFLSQKAELNQLKIDQQNQTITEWRVITVVFVIFLLLISFYLYKYFKLFDREKRLAEKERKFNLEQHHRIKNHLQVLAGLLSFQQRKIENHAAKEVIQESSSRVEVIKMLHLHFYQNTDKVNSSIQLDTYLSEIISNLIILFNREDVVVDSSLNPILISAEKALPLGLIINEIVNNALKYGLSKEGKPTLNISLNKENNQIKLQIGDNGPGLSPKETNGMSIGLELISQLVKQIDGKIEVENSKGSQYFIEFKI